MLDPMNAWQLRKPASEDEWRRYHEIRRRALFDGHLPGIAYDPDHPDERRDGNHPLILAAADQIAGTIRIDVLDERRVCFRLVAIDEALRGRGFGADLIRHAERYAARELCRHEIVMHVRRSAIPFYLKLGYHPIASWGDPPLSPDSPPFGKSLAAAPQQ